MAYLKINQNLLNEYSKEIINQIFHENIDFISYANFIHLFFEVIIWLQTF